MSASEAAERSLRDGDPAAALALLQEQVRDRPGDARLRIFLFQLLSVLGQWERALNQLKVASSLDPAALAMEQTYSDAVRCETVRDGVFGGTRAPLVFGEPEQWLALLIESLLLAGRGEEAQGRELRARAFEEAPASSGTLDGRAFEWIADADARLGPVMEAVINGRYYWVPFARLSRIEIEPPTDLRDLVWTPAHLEFANGGEAVALIPTRYPGSHAAEGPVALARKTIWEETAAGVHVGLGQRIWTTEADEVPLMQVRAVLLGDAPAEDPSAGGHG